MTEEKYCKQCGTELEEVIDEDSGGNCFLDCYWCPKCGEFIGHDGTYLDD